jgi:hypothetical protein
MNYNPHSRLESRLLLTAGQCSSKKIDWGLDMIDRLLTKSGYAAVVKPLFGWLSRDGETTPDRASGELPGEPSQRECEQHE